MPEGYLDRLQSCSLFLRLHALEACVAQANRPIPLPPSPEELVIGIVSLAHETFQLCEKGALW